MASRVERDPAADYRRLHAAYQQSLRYAEDVRRLYHQLQRAICQSLLGLANALEAKDPYTSGHSERVAALSRRVASALGLTSAVVDLVGQAGLLHDIGKIGVPEAILRKPGPLSAEEWESMRAHPVIGAQIVAPFEFFAGVARVIRHHHERWNGSGYPDGLARETIPLEPRSVAAGRAGAGARRDTRARGSGGRGVGAVRLRRLSPRPRLAVAAARAAAGARPRARVHRARGGRRTAGRIARRAPARDGLAHARLRRARAGARRPGALARVRPGRQRADDRGVPARRPPRSRAASLAVRGRRRARDRRLPGSLPRRSAAAAQLRGHRRRRVLSHPAQPRQLLALLAQRQHRARRRRGRRVLPGLPAAPRRVVTAPRRQAALLAGGLVVVITAGLAAADVSPSTPWRHLYLLPVLLAGLRFGVAGGLVAAVGAVLAFGPFVLREIEGHGPTRAAAEGIVTLAVLALSGALVGSLATRARRQRQRYETLRAVQRVLAAPAPLGRVAARLAAGLSRRLGVDTAGLVLDEGRMVAGAAVLDPRP